ncbi:DUF6880 family protein [Aphanothece minutissima]|jgi:hypothetical protein|uniref:DUF6880 family protein n=1 Tax=Aphanothece minutissima TaxID=543815 RepID=UPI003306E47D
MARCPAHCNLIQRSHSGVVNLFGATLQQECHRTVEDGEAEERALRVSEQHPNRLRGLEFLVAWEAALARAARLVLAQATAWDGEAVTLLSAAAERLIADNPLCGHATAAAGGKGCWRWAAPVATARPPSTCAAAISSPTASMTGRATPTMPAS